MSASRYPDNNRYPRDRSPYRDRRPSNFGGGYPPRGNESIRPSAESGGFPPREPPRGPKSLGDPPRGPAAGPSSGAPSAPRDGRGRGFAGRGEATPLRDAPPLSSGPAPPSHNSHNSWRADRDRDRDFDRRERRPTPPRRSPIRDSRDPRDQRDFLPRDLDVNRARRNSRDGPPSAGSTYSDPPAPGTGSSYRGSGIGRGRGGFAARGRSFHPDDRDRHHDPRDRPPIDRSYRPRSRTPPGRRERDVRDDRDFDRRDRDDRRFVPREYDSYIGPAGAAKPGPRTLDTHRGTGQSDSRHIPGTPTGPTPHSSHHASPSDRLGTQADSFSRRSSLAIDPSSAKEPRREPGKDEALLASRAEASRERYAPRASSPPASIPAFGGSNVWRAPVSEAKTSAVTAPPPKLTQPTLSAPAAPTPATIAPTIPTAPKASIPPGLSTAPPTGPKAERIPDRVPGDGPGPDTRPGVAGSQRMDPPFIPPPTVSAPVNDVPGTNTAAPNTSSAHQVSTAGNAAPMTTSTPSMSSVPAKSPPQGPAPRPRAPPVAPQAALRANASPSFSRAQLPQYAPRDASPSGLPTALGSRSGSGSGSASLINTSPKSLPANIPTGPKADRTPMATRPPSMYPPSDRPGFPAPRAPMGGGPKSMQWVRPGLIPNRPTVPTKREFPNEDRERAFGTAPKAPRLENNVTVTQTHRAHQAKSVSPSFSMVSVGPEKPRERAVSAERPLAPSPKPTSIETRRHSDVVMAEASPRLVKPPMSAASSAPEALQDSDDDLDLDEDDFAESEAKYNREKARLEAKRIDLSAPHLRATSPLQEIILLSCLTVDHLPQGSLGSGSAEETSPLIQESSDVPYVQPPPESITAELPTPKAEDPEDVEMEDKLERSAAPATMALRLRRETSADQETLPDLSSLPYLGSGPPTPLSDIGQDRPSLPDSVMLAMRNKLRNSIEPQLNTEEILQQYAAVYKQWRLSIRPWDEERDQDDPERQPSAEPALKVITPDVQSAAMTGILDGSLAPTGRRSHASRWATELDLEAVIKESLKTAEEERMGKKEKEPRRAMADPEREATLPLELTESEAERRRFIDTNFQREPGQGIFVFHYEPPEDDFTEEEHRVMVHNYKDQYAKKWGKLAEVLYKEVGTERTYKDCINHYYATKWGREYKGKLKGRRGGVRKRGGALSRNRGAIANMDRPENPGEEGMPLPVTETGRPRRSAAPTFGGPEAEFDPTTSVPTPGRARRQTDADGTQEKAGRRGKAAKDKLGRKAKNLPLAAAPAGSPVKIDRKEKGLGVKLEDEFGKRPLGEMPLPIHAGLMEDQMLLSGDTHPFAGLPPGMMERPKAQASARPGPSSYWSVSELQDFDKNVAHFGTDWLAIANHMGTKTHTMIKNQYLRLVEGGRLELEQVAKEADMRRERGDDLGPPPTPTPAPKRRYESTQPASIRQIAPTPEHKSPLLNALTLPKTSPPNASSSSSRFSTIAQAPSQGKPLVPAPGYPNLPETNLASVPSMPQQQSPPAPPQRTQPQHQHQHKQPHLGPRAGYFSDDLPSRLENRLAAQPTTAQQPPRTMQQQVPSQIRAHEQHQSPIYRSLAYQERDNVARSDAQQEQEAQHRYQQHARRISQEMHHHRSYGPAAAPPLMPPAQPINQASAEVYSQGHGTISGTQQLPPRSTVLTPPVKEEPRNPPPSMMPQAQQPLHLQHQLQPQLSQAPTPSAPAASGPKPAEPRKSNLMSLLNDDGPEEPRRKKPSDQGPSSHSTTPAQSAPIAPPPPTTQVYSSSTRRSVYDEPNTTQSAYTRPSYVQQSSLPPTASNRSIDLTGEQGSGTRPGLRESWPQRQQFHPGQNQAQQPASLPASQSSLPQPSFSDVRLFGNHRSVFAQHNAPRHNPSPPPLAGYGNSPHLHSRTPSISGPRPGVPSTTASQHSQTPGASSQILQPNPYGQLDPPGSSAQPSGPMGMRPSPHIHTSHLAQQREPSGRNEHAQAQNANLSYSNPQTPNEQPGHQQLRGPGSIADSYRGRDLRDPRDPHRDLDSRNSDRDTSRELSQRTDYLRDQLSNQGLRSTGPPLHEDLRYPPQQDRGYLSQRSQTPLSRLDNGQPPPLQHPPHSSLGAANVSIYGQRAPEEPSHRFSQPFSRDRNIADHFRDEQALQQQAAINRDDFMRRETEREMRDREIREQDARFRDNLMRGRDMRGPPPPGAAGPGAGAAQQEQRPTPNGPGLMDWANAVRHSQDRGGWQR
ncbi:Nn.00g069090.m01.CDS01 [Neocucurbitaria sp. VM-36]